MMDSITLAQLCKKDKKICSSFIGVFACDQLPNKIPFPCCLIVNTKPISHEGEHWAGIHIDTYKRGTYFCSYGVYPVPKVAQWIQKNTASWVRNQKRVQGDISSTCGQYCICFLHFLCRSVSFSLFLSLFTNNKFENDIFVTHFINGYYKCCTTMFEVK